MSMFLIQLYKIVIILLLREKDHKKSYLQKLFVIPFGGSKISITIYAYISLFLHLTPYSYITNLKTM